MIRFGLEINSASDFFLLQFIAYVIKISNSDAWRAFGYYYDAVRITYVCLIVPVKLGERILNAWVETASFSRVFLYPVVFPSARLFFLCA